MEHVSSLVFVCALLPALQWIKTQETLVRSGVSRFIEIGPQPTLAPMLKRSTLDVGLEYLWIGADMATICYENEGVEEEAATAFAQSAPVLPTTTVVAPVAVAAPVTAAPVAAAPRAAGSAAAIPLTALHAIRLITSIKLKLSFADCDPSKSLKTLAGGKSALQNEVLGDIANEFKSEPDGAAELSLSDLAGKVGGGYAGPGKVLQGMATKNMALALPGAWGKSKASSWLVDTYGVGVPTAEAIITHALMHKAAARHETEAAAQAWLAEVAAGYASANGTSLSASTPSAGGAAAGPSSGPVAVVDAKEIANLKVLFRDQLDLLGGYLGTSSSANQLLVPSDFVDAEYLRHIESELDVKFLQGIVPIFDARKCRTYDAAWNWVKQDALEAGLHRGVKLDSLTPEQVYSFENRATPELLSLVAGTEATKARLEPFVLKASKYRELRVPTISTTTVTKEGKMTMASKPRYAKGYADYVADMTADANERRLKLMKATERNEPDFGGVFRKALSLLASEGVSFAGKLALLTGCGAGSIGLEVTKCLLQAGANVVVTTSQPIRARYELFRRTYQAAGGKCSSLRVIPFNGASRQDCAALIADVGVPHFLFPFAALSENGRDISSIDGMSELAHRTMLTNVLRLLGAIKTFTPNAKNPNSFCLSILPLSPNHGIFGSDGLYAESKIGLETLYYKSKSEGWSNRIGLIGAEIGWTKGTGLMSSNDLISEGIEAQAGVRTFDAAEMAFNLVALCTEPLVELAKQQPLHADLSGGFATAKGGLPAARIRAELQRQADIQRAVHTDALIDLAQTSPKQPVPRIEPRAHLALEFPKLPKLADKSSTLEGMLDLTRVPVVVGFGEVGPWGNAASRWEAEVSETFSSSGAIQLARSMGFIKYFNGRLPSGKQHIGWMDAATNEPLADMAIAARFAKRFAADCGIRPVNPALFKGYNPSRKMLLQQTSLAAELKPFEVSTITEAEHLKSYHGNKLEVYRDGERLMARLKDGATIYMPKAVTFDRTVAGQLPSTWDASKYLPKDIINQVDPITVYALASTMDALASAGLHDPYELYRHVHVSEVGNSVGGGMGGMASLQGIFRHRMLDAQGLQSDQLQESFINTTAAWLNMLLLSSCGPLTTPVAACATAAVALELGVNAIRAGKAKVMLVGGTEDFCEEGSYEFAQMGATSSGVAEAAEGREPSEASRPCASSRHGFMESQGAGVQILTSAALALEMGLPIYAIVGGVSTATDRQGRSIPAPGVGILSTARESTRSEAAGPSPLLSVAYRRRQLERELTSIDAWLDEESSLEDADMDFLHAESERRISAAKRAYSNDFFENRAEIAPLRAQLAVWGLSPDDLEAVSFHGTSTQANDKNESNVVHMQMEHLGRSTAKPLPVIAQKWLTGHPKVSEDRVRHSACVCERIEVLTCFDFVCFFAGCRGCLDAERSDPVDEQRLGAG
jgi:3-oxoacyl-ACP reductase-like protein